MLFATALATPDGEYRLGPYDVSAGAASSPGMALGELVGDRAEEVGRARIIRSVVPGESLERFPRLPPDGWRVIAGSIPPPENEYLAAPPWPIYPECVIAAPWPENPAQWLAVEITRQIESTVYLDPTVYGQPDTYPRIAHGDRWSCAMFADDLRPGRARRRRGLEVAFDQPDLRIAAGDNPRVPLRLTNRGRHPWLNRAPRWEHDTDGVNGLVADVHGVVLSDRWPPGVGMGVKTLPDLQPGESVELIVSFVAVGLGELSPGEYRILAELLSLHLPAPALPLFVL